MNPKTLEQIGLTKNEAKVYLILLKYGMLKATEILKKAELNSGKIYDILEGLETKGLVGESIIDKIRHFTASPPDELLEFVSRKKEEINKEEEIIKKNLPELKKLREYKTKEVKAMTFTGLKGLKVIVYDLLDKMNKGDLILGMGITEYKDPKYNKFWQSCESKRKEKNIGEKLIISDRGKYYQDVKKLFNTKVRVLTGITPVSVAVYGKENVLISNYTDPSTSTLIQDANTAKSFIQFFEQLWKQAKA
jgi:HTH-type transcriptional regulator, sugar sensing transcriptional regulator